MTALTEDHTTDPAHHLVALVVENKSGVLVRVAGLFARRGFNIVSLAVAPTHDPRFSRISIVVDAESAPLEQVVSQLNKLVNVVAISELHPFDAREAELLMATVSCAAPSRGGLVREISAHGGVVVDESAEALTVMVAGAPEMLDELEATLRGHGIVELQRTGRIALPKLRPTK